MEESTEINFGGAVEEVASLKRLEKPNPKITINIKEVHNGFIITKTIGDYNYQLETHIAKDNESIMEIVGEMLAIHKVK